jgi:hypothetical protein
MILKEEIQFIKNLEINTLNKFNFQVFYNNWIHEYYVLFNKPAPEYILKKQLKKQKYFGLKTNFYCLDF